MDSEDKTILMAIIILFAVLTIGQIFSCMLESKAFNELTGSKTTWMDAMWLELRVSSDSK